MAKGLPRSLSRGDRASNAEILKRSIPVDKTVDISATGAAVGFGSVVLEGLPEGHLVVLGTIAKFVFDASGDQADLTNNAWDGDFSLGSTPTADATLSGTDVDIVASTTIPQAAATSVAGPVSGLNTTSAVLDNSDGSLEINLNVLIDAADIADDSTVTVAVRGTVEITYLNIGDDDV